MKPLAALLLALLPVAPLVAADDPLAGADARIDRCRKADAVIRVVDASGNPVPRAAVDVQQVRHQFLFGSNIFKWGKMPTDAIDQTYRGRFEELLNYATLPYYWWGYEPQRGRPAHAHAEKVARWCKEHGIATKGHPLMWNHTDPAWLSGDPAETRRLQMARIDDCVHRFAGLIDRWDVVNEVTHFERDEFLKQAPKMSAMWLKYGRVEVTRECFQRARLANPGATLLINDYRTDPAYEQLIEKLVDSQGKRLYDAIGIQSHMHGGAWPTEKLWETCNRFSRFGVPLHFTELTVLSGKLAWNLSGKDVAWPSTREGEAYQAREVVRIYTMLFSHPAVEAITWWDFADLDAWQHAPAGLLRKDMSPKPAYDELKRLVRGRWWTNVRVETGPDGTARVRGFLGDYRLTAAAGGAKGTAEKVTLEKGKDNRWTVRVY